MFTPKKKYICGLQKMQYTFDTFNNLLNSTYQKYHLKDL